MNRLERRLDWVVIAAAMLVIPSVYLETETHGRVRDAGVILDWLIWIAFAVEFVVAIVRTSDRKRWLRQHPLEIVVVFLTPPFAPATLQTLRVFRVLRFVRLLRLAPVMRRTFSLDGAKYLAVLTALAVVGGGDAFASAEGTSPWDGVWWAVVTTTTVGYGDIYPHTVLGRLIAVGLMVLGIGFVAVLTGAVAQRFLAHETARVAHEAEVIEKAEFDTLAELREIIRRVERIERALTNR